MGLGGCGDDAAPADSEDGTGSTGASSTDASSTGVDGTGADTTGADTTVTGSTTDDTSDPIQVSVLLLGDLEVQGTAELFWIDYTDGVVSPPIRLSEPAGTSVLNWSLSSSQTRVFYGRVNPAQPGDEYGYVPIVDGQPGSSVPVNTAPELQDETVSGPELTADETSLVFNVRGTAQVGYEQLWSAAIDDQAVAAPDLLIETPQGTPTLGTSLALDSNGNQVAFLRTQSGGPTDVWTADISTPGPHIGTALTVHTEPWQGIPITPRFASGDALLYFFAESDIEDVNELFMVDLSGAAPGSPVKVHAPLVAGQTTTTPRLSPDGTRLAYLVRGVDTADADVWVVDFVGGRASMPTRLSTLGDQQVQGNLGWSRDGRWIVYAGHHDMPDVQDLYAVNMSGAQPSAPMLVTAPGLMNDNVEVYRFGPNSQWLYIAAAIDSTTPQLYRADLSGDVPGPLQQLNGPLVEGGYVPGFMAVSSDGEAITYLASADDAGVFELYLVDLSGPQPGPALKVNGPLGANEEVGTWARFSADDDAILYQTRTGAEDPEPLWLVERDALEVAVPLASNGYQISVVGPATSP